MIEKIYTPLRKLMFAFVFMIAISFLYMFFITDNSVVSQWTRENELALFIGCIILIFLWILPYYSKLQVISKRSKAIAALASKSGIKLFTNPSKSPVFGQIALRDATFFNTLAGSDWRYGDHRHTLYGRTRSGEYEAAFVYYSVLELDLPRRLPHIIFDSKESHRKQLSALFDRSQRHSLEGNFDAHFSTYFPKFYTIDGLSIITPEVMQAMIAADQFDIEIWSDKLYLYGPLVPTADLPSMIEQGKLIRQKLMNNIVTYRDEKLDDMDRSKVAMFGAHLRPNPYIRVPFILLGLLLLGLFSYLAITYSQQIFELLIFGGVFVVEGTYTIWKTKRESRAIDKAYRLSAEQDARVTSKD